MQEPIGELDFVSTQAKERAESRHIALETITYCLLDYDGRYRNKDNTVYWKDLPDDTRVKVSVGCIDGALKIVNALIIE